MRVYVGSYADIKKAADNIYISMLKQRAAQHGDTLYTQPPSLNKSSLSFLTDDALIDIPLLGYKNGQLNVTSGFCITFDKPKERKDLPGSFWIQKHPSINPEVQNLEEADLVSDWLFETV